jgi:hypothetical protein
MSQMIVIASLLTFIGQANAQTADQCKRAKTWITCEYVQAQSCGQLHAYAAACGVGRARQLAIAVRCGVTHCVRR